MKEIEKLNIDKSLELFDEAKKLGDIRINHAPFSMTYHP